MQAFNITQDLPEQVFRAYDIRGKVDSELTPDFAYTIGLAVGSEAQELGINTIVVGRDGRLSGEALLLAVVRGILDTGTNIINIGEVPTPVLYYATHKLGTYSGVMVTGSHNPKGYNGFKMVLAGKTLFGDRIVAIHERARNQNFVEGKGEASSYSIADEYVERICSDVKLQKPFKIVVDCGNGVTGKVVPELYRALGCEVIELFCDIDGNFPNHHPDPSVKENMLDLIDAVRENNADIGLAFDGDGDRLGVICDGGEMIYPDRQLMLFSQDVLERNPGAAIIFDVKCSQNLPKVIKQHRGNPVMWKTGHSYIKTKMAQMKSPLSGEMSGHIFFKERWYGFDDALYAGARFLEILAKDDRKCSEVFAALPDSVNTPEIKLPIDDKIKFTFIENFVESAEFENATLNTIDGLRIDFENGWGLIRASNTTPCLTLRFEAQDEQALQNVQRLFREKLLAFDNTLELPF